MHLFIIYMELNKICKMKSINLSKKLIDVTETKTKVKKTHLKSDKSKTKVNKKIHPLVVIQTGSFIIRL